MNSCLSYCEQGEEVEIGAEHALKQKSCADCFNKRVYMLFSIRETHQATQGKPLWKTIQSVAFVSFSLFAGAFT